MTAYNTQRVRTFKAGAAIAQYLRVKLSSAKLAAAGATDVELGQIDVASFADGDIVPVTLRTAQGTVIMVANGAITAGNAVYAAASGKVASSGTIRIGQALEAATADNDQIEVLRDEISGSEVIGVAGGYKIARGQATTASASDTVVTGLATVVSCVANLEDAPVIGCDRANGVIGDQAGAPAAGSILIKTYKPTATGDATPIAATTFGKKVNWVAVGT